MIKELTKYPAPLYSPVEKAVYFALKGLPPPFKLKQAPFRLMFETDTEDCVVEPDFAVECPGGKLLFVEAKSYRALSMWNLARFGDMNDYLESEGHGFLVIVPDAPEVEKTTFVDADLRILPVAFVDDAEIVTAVLEAAKKLLAPSTSQHQAINTLR